MYLHIGGAYSVPDKTLIGIFDFDEVTGQGSATHIFLQKARDHHQIDIISDDLPRTLIVTVERIYVSPISARTLRNRADNMRTDIRDMKQKVKIQ
jgi:extracellular matrix regulatory protein B